MKYTLKLCWIAFLILQSACSEESETRMLSLVSARIGTMNLSTNSTISNVPVNQPIILEFSVPLVEQSVNTSISVQVDGQSVPVTLTYPDEQTVMIDPVNDLLTNAEYSLVISNQLKGSGGEIFSGLVVKFKTALGELKILHWTLGDAVVNVDPIQDVPLNVDLQLEFNTPLQTQSVSASSISLTGASTASLVYSLSSDRKTLTITSADKLRDLAKYKIVISNGIEGEQQETFTGFEIDFYTALDPVPDFPIIPDEELLTWVQQQTFKYFWDFAHPASGMARERNTSGDIVTSGGSGFGIMSLIVGIERNFITREQGLTRMEKILDFLETADRFHGAWPHWMNGNTGDVVPFSPNDNGGDLVETSFLLQGLLTFRQYLDGNIPVENSLVDRINALWEGVEWDWYTRGGQNVLYWHWSPDKQWTMNHPIRGYNEALITYFLAAASPTHPVDATVYHEGWAANGGIRNNKTFYGFPLPLGPDYGGPLFFAHYSFLGLDPRTLADSYATYWAQNVNHAKINHAYSVDNPKDYVGYSDENWGLTASDNRLGYSAHSPTNDLGVITPTAALSSFPYSPEESMKALKFFYYTLGDRLWGPYGFYDAFNITEGWTANSYLAIDQGPLIVMIENHRSGLLWNLFMSAPEVQVSKDKLGFAP